MAERPVIDEPYRPCPKCGKLHQGTARSGWCHTCLTMTFWYASGEKFRAANAGVEAAGYDGTRDPAATPSTDLRRIPEDP